MGLFAFKPLFAVVLELLVFKSY